MVGTPVQPLATLNSGGSGFGISYYKEWAACPRRGHFAAEARANADPKKVPGPALLFGTFFHALLEQYYTQGESFGLDAMRQAPALCEADNSVLAIYKEAEDLFRRYRVKYAWNEFGIPLGAELSLPRVPEEAGRICTAVGVEPFTAAIDLVVDIPAGIYRDLKLDAGVYLVDHKTSGQRRQSTINEFNYSYQFTAYMLAYEAATGVRPQGLLVNCAYRQRKSFEMFLIRYPDPVKVRQLHYFLKIAKAREHGPAICIPVPENCHGKYGTCPWFNRCPRS